MRRTVFDSFKDIPTQAGIILRELIYEINLIDPDFIKGAYVLGSIPLQDFHPGKSDIDFLITCETLPAENLGPQLRIVHKRIQRRFPKPDLSGCYVACDSLKAEDVSNVRILSWHEGSLRFQSFEMAVITLYQLKTSAITIVGNSHTQLEINIDQKQVSDFMHRNMNSYWRNWIDQHSNWFKRKLILFLFPRFTEWVLLGLGRMLYTLLTGEIASKSSAGEFCLNILPANFHALIQLALKTRRDTRTYPIVKSYLIRPSLSRLNATLYCAKYLIEEFNSMYTKKGKE